MNVPTWEEVWAGLERYCERKGVTVPEYMSYETGDGQPIAVWFLQAIAAREMHDAARLIAHISEAQRFVAEGRK